MNIVSSVHLHLQLIGLATSNDMTTPSSNKRLLDFNEIIVGTVRDTDKYVQHVIKVDGIKFQIFSCTTFEKKRWGIRKIWTRKVKQKDMTIR